MHRKMCCDVSGWPVALVLVILIVGGGPLEADLLEADLLEADLLETARRVPETPVKDPVPPPVGPGQAPEAIGGPDDSGYGFIDSNEPGGPSFSFVDISGTGTAVLLADDGEQSVPIGFGFPFYDSTYGDVFVISNGFLSFEGGAATSFTNECPFDGTDPNIIAPYWDDLDPGDDGAAAYYQTFANCPVGKGACFVVQWEEFDFFPGDGAPGGSAGTFQVVLYEVGTILMQYEGGPGLDGSGATIGISNDGAGNSLLYGCNSGGIDPGLAIEFGPGPIGDLAILMLGEIVVGSPSFFDLVVVNFGPEDQTGVRVTDTLPPELVFLGDTCDGMIGGQDWSWDIGDLAVGEVVDCRLSVELSSEDCATVTNTATVSGDLFDPQHDNTSTVSNGGGEEVADPGFEQGTPNPDWDELSTNFGTPICDLGTCGNGTGSGPRSGSYWAWFGGIAAFEEASVSQDVVISGSAPELTFWLEMIVCAGPADFLEVRVDGDPVFRVDGSSPLCGQLGYRQQTVDLSTFADGATHRLELYAQTGGTGTTNFFVDDVSLTGEPVCWEAKQEKGCQDCGEGPAAACACESQNCGGDETGGDPVYLFSGEFYESVVDLRIPGRGTDFVWARKYRSRLGPDTVQGNGWDCSYNIRLEQRGANRVLYDGNTRQDTYHPVGDGTWNAGEFYRTLEQNPDGSHTLRFADTSTWTFHPFDGTPGEGKIRSIVERNGNTLGFAYDGEGRLVTITDTLDRDIELAYNRDGLIESVTDFIGRQVRYEYYQDGDAGGSAGDLRSVTTPVVTGTPNGNDFPDGKTTVYTYTTGFADEALNHNLLTITDPKGQTFLTNVYGQTTDPADLGYDRVVRQIWGGPGDIVDFVYQGEMPDADNGFADRRAIVNDRVGNVREVFFSGNRNVLQREYTGRADPDQPTTALDNRPTGRLRPDDPEFFETRWVYNTDGRMTEVIHPNGNKELLTYDVGHPDRRAHGNVVQRCLDPGPLSGDQPMICEAFEYDDGFGGCCGTNFVTRHVDARGAETLHTYDANGNRLSTQHRIPSIVEDFEYNAFGQLTARVLPDNGSGHRRRDERTYYDGGPQTGYLESETLDVGGLDLTTLYEVDAVGNRVRVVDPAGHDTQYEFNALDQVVRELSAEVELAQGTVRYTRDTWYDANDNVVRIDVENLDDQGIRQPNSHFTTVYEYEVLDYPVRECREVGDYTGAIPGSPALPTCDGFPDDDFLTTEHAYDANRNRTLTRYGEAVEGRDPFNLLRTLHDERDLVFRQIRAEGDGKLQSTAQFDYDPNRNLARTHEGLEGVPRVTEHAYDGYDRRTRSLDPMGNTMRYGYDANHNRVHELSEGERVDVPGSTGNVRLAEKTLEYDPMDRQIRTVSAFFTTADQTPIGDGEVVTETEWSDDSQVLLVRDDNGHETRWSYDTANRRATVTDAKGNTVTRGYDADSLVIDVTEVEKPDLGGADQVFHTTRVYDSLHRPVERVDNVGNTHRYGYDSRHNETRVVDALGHEVRHVYDGIDRRVATHYDLDDDGADGDGKDITTRQEWDDTSRLVAQIDDHGNRTRYVYDALNRKSGEVYADGTELRYTLDVHDNRIREEDANGSVSTCEFDLLDRMERKDVLPARGVSNDTTFEVYGYDGLSRRVRAEDDDSLVVREYDSLSRVTRETLDGEMTECLYDGVGNQLETTYPGGRRVTTSYDALDRKQDIRDAAGPIASYAYVGPGRVERREYGNGSRTDYTYDGITGVPNPPGDFGVKRIVEARHRRADGSLIDDRTFLWDRMANKTRRRDVRVGGPEVTHDYYYDSIYRLIRTVASDPGGSVLRDEQYVFDGVGNRRQVRGGENPGGYELSPTLPEPADQQMNQYTRTPFDLRIYDRNGNLIRDGTVFKRPNIVYDYRNRMVEYRGDDSTTTHYRYDALGRRIERTLDALGTRETVRYLYDGWQVLEEQDGRGATTATYVYGLYIDEALQMQRGGVDYYYHADDLYNVMALSDGSGKVVERYEYGDYGQGVDPVGLAALPGGLSTLGNSYGFTGRRYDPESDWYHYRTRYLDPAAGRFTARDTIGIWGDSENVGSGDAYLRNRPVTLVDPMGEGWSVCMGTCLLGVTVAEWKALQAVGFEIVITHLKNRRWKQANRAAKAGFVLLAKSIGGRRAAKIAAKFGARFAPGVGQFVMALDVCFCLGVCW